MTFINPMTYRNSTGAGWRGKVEEIRAATDEFHKYESIMTLAERTMVGDSIKKKKSQYYSEVAAGMKAELNQAANTYKEKVAAFGKGQQRENASWESVKLGAEMHTFQTILNMRLDQYQATQNPLGASLKVGSEINDLYHEWHSSGDKYKQRAAAEVMRSITPKINEVKDHNQAAQLRTLAKQADEDLKDIRMPNELLDLAIEADKSAETLLKKKAELIDIAKLMGEVIDPVFGGTGDMSKLLRTVQQDRKTGHINIYSIDAPEVTGVYPPSDSDFESFVVGG